MPLTPEDVSNKRFTPVRLREGYDMGEVDQFLDEVESELARLIKENDDLRAKLGAARGVACGTLRPGRSWRPRPEAAGARAGRGGACRPLRCRRRCEEIKVATVAEASSAAARLLEIATRNADELVGEARAEADQILGDARTEAERLEAETKTKSDQLEADARTRAADARLRDRGAPHASSSATSRGRRAGSTARSRTCVPSSGSTAAG